MHTIFVMHKIYQMFYSVCIYIVVLIELAVYCSCIVAFVKHARK